MGGEWYLEKRGSRKILAGSRNLGSVFDKSPSLVFSYRGNLSSISSSFLSSHLFCLEVAMVRKDQTF